MNIGALISPKKRTADGDVKYGQIWQADEVTSALLQAESGEEKSKIKLHGSVDMLKRRIAALRLESETIKASKSALEYLKLAEEPREVYRDLTGKREGAIKSRDYVQELEEVVIR